MKQLFIAAIFTSLLFGCQPENTTAPIELTACIPSEKASRLISANADHIDKNKISRVLEIGDRQSKKEAYLNDLNEFEKYYYWVNRVNRYAAYNNISEDKKVFLKDFVDHLDPAYFSSPEAGANFHKKFVGQWSLKAESVLGLEACRSLIGGIDAINPPQATSSEDAASKNRS